MRSLMRCWAVSRVSAAAFQSSLPSLATRKMSKGGIIGGGVISQTVKTECTGLDRRESDDGRDELIVPRRGAACRAPSMSGEDLRDPKGRRRSTIGRGL